MNIYFSLNLLRDAYNYILTALVHVLMKNIMRTTCCPVHTAVLVFSNGKKKKNCGECLLINPPPEPQKEHNCKEFPELTHCCALSSGGEY